MKLWLLLAATWTVVVVIAIVFFVPGIVNAPGCASMVGISAACLEEIQRENDRIWWSHTLPVLLVIVGGYVAVTLVALGRRRRGRSVSG